VSLAPDSARRLLDILEQDTVEDFATLVDMSGLDRTRAFRRADLRDVDFGAMDVVGLDVSGADLWGADLTRVRGAEGLRYNRATRWPANWLPPSLLPPDFLEQAMRMVLRGEPPPAAWVPYITEMDFDESDWAKTLRSKSVRVGGSSALQDLTPLAGLTGLQGLDLNGTQVSDLAPIAGLRNLTILGGPQPTTRFKVMRLLSRAKDYLGPLTRLRRSRNGSAALDETPS
jgi:hypothetical protein